MGTRKAVHDASMRDLKKIHYEVFLRDIFCIISLKWNHCTLIRTSPSNELLTTFFQNMGLLDAFNITVLNDIMCARIRCPLHC